MYMSQVKGEILIFREDQPPNVKSLLKILDSRELSTVLHISLW